MSGAVASRETSRSTLHLLRGEAAARGEIAPSSARAFGPTSHDRSATPLGLRSASEPTALGITNDPAPGGLSARVLVIDDDPVTTPEQLRPALPTSAYRVRVVGTSGGWLNHVGSDSPDVVVLDLGPDPQSGLDVYRQVRRRNARVPVIVTAKGRRADTAIEAMKEGAYDCLFKPFDPAHLRRVVGDAMDVARRMREPAAAVENDPD